MNLPPNFSIRPAVKSDAGLILRFIKELADYEGLLSEVVATQQLLEHWVFEKQKAEVIIAQVGDEAVGFALYFHNFSTFLGRSGLYLEDLYVVPHMRGNGCGKALLAYLAKLCKQRGCGRLEWWCLDENKPSINFYKALGAEAMSDWTVYRMTGDALDNLAANSI